MNRQASYFRQNKSSAIAVIITTDTAVLFQSVSSTKKTISSCGKHARLYCLLLLCNSFLGRKPTGTDHLNGVSGFFKKQPTENKDVACLILASFLQTLKLYES